MVAIIGLYAEAETNIPYRRRPPPGDRLAELGRLEVTTPPRFSDL